jgi:endonuclease/exonuclease/phosphatase family metal-dependent hydrolase
MFTLLSLNVYLKNYLDKVVPFVIREKADIICLQEVYKSTAIELSKKLDFHFVHLPTTHILESDRDSCGVAILSRHPIKESHFWYLGEGLSVEADVHYPNGADAPHSPALLATLQLPTGPLTICNVHLPWYPDGKVVIPFQQRALDRLLVYLRDHPSLVLVGDMNSARGFPLFDRIAAHYTDHIPPEVLTTIDQQLHNVKGLQLVVDGLFATSDIKVSNVQVRDGVSDHQAILGCINK